MKNTMQYKNYTGSVNLSEADAVFYGSIIGVKASITFEGDSVASLVEDFHSAVDEYLEHCANAGIEPERPYKGTFNVRIKPELHRQAAEFAMSNGQTLNAFVEDAIAQRVQE